MPGPFLSVARRSPRRSRRLLVLLLVVLAALAVAAAVFGVLALTERGTIARGTTIGGVDVGGLSEADARRVLRRAAELQLERPIELVAPSGRLTTTGRVLGAEPRL